MLGGRTHRFLLEHPRTGLILRLAGHCVITIIVKMILLHLLLFLQLAVKLSIVAELFLVIFEQRVLEDRRKGQSFLAVQHEDLLEEVLHICWKFLQPVLFGQCCG